MVPISYQTPNKSIYESIAKKIFKSPWFQGAFWFIMGIVSTMIFNCYYSKEKMQLKQKHQPIIAVELSENKIGEFYLSVESKKGDTVNNFSLIYTLPGVLKEHVVDTSKFVNECEIINLFASSHGGSIDPDTLSSYGGVADSETLSLNCKSILPGGYYRVKLSFAPSNDLWKDTWIKIYPSLNLKYFTPLTFGYPWYEQYIYTWSFDGREENILDCIDLTDKNYIKNDIKIMEEVFHRNKDEQSQMQKINKQKICY